MIDKLLESVSVPSLAVTVALYVPWSLNPGARRILPVAVPVPGLVVVTAMKLGPDAAKAYVEDDYIFVVLEGGLTRNEETLLGDGKDDVVRRYRLEFQETVAVELPSVISDQTRAVVVVDFFVR